jgi:hypothetical protein
MFLSSKENIRLCCTHERFIFHSLLNISLICTPVQSHSKQNEVLQSVKHEDITGSYHPGLDAHCEL